MTQSNKQSYNYPQMTTILFWCGLVVLSSMYVTIPLATVLSDSFHKSMTQVASLASSYSICYAVGCLLYGPFSDRYGRKVFLVGSLSLLTVLTFAIGFVDNFYILLILRGLQGLISAAFAPISLVYAGEMFPPEKRLTAVGFVSSGLLMAGVVGQVYSGLVNELWGWQAIFFQLGILYFLTLVLIIVFLPKDEMTRPHVHMLDAFKKMTLLGKQPQLLLAFCITFSLLFSLVGMYTILGSYLSNQFGLTEKEILFVRAVGIIGMLLSLFAGRLAQRLGTTMILKIGLALAAAGLFGIGASPSLPLIIFFSIIFVLGIATANPIVISVVSQLAGHARGSAVSFNAFILFVGASTGPILALTLNETGIYQLSFSVLGCILMVAVFLSFFIKMTSSAQVKVKPSN
ncbi:MFS transporter [Robertmurraya korlensis]|uniref:MFS transporter n=1 Tax=Robertmurraya korlensis TaxID=519977 RepID=UPI0020406E0B|nr:MFS transporter [Robertmurraya korlensis]MCM3600905.1 MFS transporter [Robertmurraya korlensis]